ncbi:MAG: class I SAM-dependent methyltransferase [Candidatus Nitrotoga sp.]
MASAAFGDVQTVIDLGTGTGRFWPALRHAFPEAQIIAIDINAPMLTHSEANLDRVCRIVADVSQLPLKDHGADYALCSMLLHHVDDPKKVLVGLRSSLRTGGRVFVRQGTQETVDSFFFLKFFPTALKIEQDRMPASGEVLGMIESSGLSVIETRQILTPPATTVNDYLTRVKARGFPSLQLVSDEEFQCGIDQLRRHFDSPSNASEVLAGEATAIFICEVPNA